jgi:hypothetical protein
MGVLEDAIREHLELKRQHGASEEEVVRQETEVLGQARRQAASPEGEEELEAAVESGVAEEGEPVADEAIEEPAAEVAEPAFDESLGPEDAAPYADEPAESPYLEEPAEPGSVSEPASPVEEPFDHALEEEPPSALEPDPSRDETALLDDPVEFDELEPGVAPPMPAHKDGDPPAEGAEEDEDVLEETPEFLQETPEHDRLWFEQKPPRDFDFD